MVKLRGVWLSVTEFNKTLEATKNDYGRTVHLQLQDRMGSGLSLTTSGAVLLSARRRDDTLNLISGQTCISSISTLGVFTYTIQSGDLVNAGKYHVQASYRNASQEITVGGMYLHVKEDYTPR